MRVTDIIRGVLDIVDRAEQPEQEEHIAIAIQQQPQPEEEMQIAVMQQLAGIISEPEQEQMYANEPNELVSGMDAACPSGTDMHHSKNPADIKSNSISMYPGFQAGVR
jgi:hypothetical protein